MKVARIHSYGHSEQLRIESIPAPDAREGEALIRVKAAAVNPVDWKIREGAFVSNKKGSEGLPRILGQDFSGVIVKAEESNAELPEEQEFEPGDEVLGRVTGAYAEYVVLPLRDLVMKPQSIDFVLAASIPTPALTAWQALFEIARVSSGSRVLIHGAAGGVGSIMVQLCKWKGAKVIATATGNDVPYVRSLGADEAVDYKSERFEDRAHDMDAVMDLIGGETQARSWGVLKKGGVLVNTIGETDEAKALAAGVRAEMIVMRYDVGQLREIVRLFDQGILKMRIARIFPFEQARQALDLNQNGHSSGKVVIKVA
jgi:NADPH:quinone reductase-like Zn-dependent oxidoreductase